MIFNKYNLITAILFVVAFICVLLNFLTDYLNLVAICLLAVATGMLTYKLYKYCVMKNAYLTGEKEEIIMELSMQEGMEQYIPVEKKQTGFKKFIENARIFSPCILSGLFSVLFLVLLIMSLVKLF